jgi:hypothetical protein
MATSAQMPASTNARTTVRPDSTKETAAPVADGSTFNTVAAKLLRRLCLRILSQIEKGCDRLDPGIAQIERVEVETTIASLAVRCSIRLMTVGYFENTAWWFEPRSNRGGVREGAGAHGK